MSSGKMSPRQKMINMMYLVLTAMLALNVSAEILAAFETIKKKLNESAQNAEGSARGAIQLMSEKIESEKKAGQNQHQGILDSLPMVHARTTNLINFINKIDTGLLMLPGMRDPKTGEIGKKDESEMNFRYLLATGEENNGRGAGKAKELRDSLNAVYAWFGSVYNVNRTDSTGKWTAKYMTVSDPEPSGDHGGGTVKKSWERFNFEGPIVANRAMLEAMKQDVYERENRLLNSYAARLGLKLEKIPPKDPPKPEEQKPIEKIPPVKPEDIPEGVPYLISAPYSSVVPAGMQFKTKLYIGIKQKTEANFSSSAGTIAKDADGETAVLTIPASGNFPAGKAEMEQTYTVNATAKMLKGGTKTLTPYNGKFTIRKPEIVVTSASIQNLYRYCGNMINIDVPALGDLYNPSVTASDADIKPSAENKKKFLIVPRGNKCVVGVSTLLNGTTLKIGDVVYNVIDPPKPSIELFIGGQRATAGMAVGKGSQVKLVVKSDPEFKSLLPQDARYEVTDVELFRACGLQPPQRAGGKNLSGIPADGEGITFPIPGEAFQCPSGSKIFFEIKDVVRKNFQGKKVPDNRFTLYEKSISVLTK